MMYDPAEKEKKEVSQFLIDNFKFKKIEPPIECEMVFYMPIPKSKKIEEGEFHISRPDTDNMVKRYLDTFNGILYDDDSHISVIMAKKIYSEKPRIEIKLQNVKYNKNNK